MLRRLMQVLLVVLALIFGATVAAVIVAESAWFKNKLRTYIEHQANQYVNGNVTIGRLDGNLISGIEIGDVAVTLDGQPLASIKDIDLHYSVWQIISNAMVIREISLVQPVIYLRREQDGWSIGRLVKRQASEADRQGPMKPLTIADIGISDGTLAIEGGTGLSGVDVPKRFEHVDAKFDFRYEPVHYSVKIAHVSFRGLDPAFGLNSLSGAVSVRDDALYLEKLAVHTEESTLLVDGAIQNYLSNPLVKVQASSDKTSLPEIAKIVPALDGIELQPAFELKVDGSMASDLGVELTLKSAAGDASGKVTIRAQAPNQSVKGDLSVRHLDVAPFLKDRRHHSDITADAQVDVRGTFSNLNTLQGTVDLKAPRIVAAGYAADHVDGRLRINGRRITVAASTAAYGATLTANGRVTIPAGTEPVAFDLGGRARHVDLRRLPRTLGAPPAATDIAGEYHVSGRAGSTAAASIDADLRFDDSTVAGMRIARGSTARVSAAGRDLQYAADASLTNLDLARVGREFKVPALATDRYASFLNGRFVVNGRGTEPRTMEVTANGTLEQSTILGGQIPHLTFDASLAHDALAVKAAGRVENVDPAVASGKPAAKGTVAGTVDVDLTLDHLSAGVTPDSLQGTARIALEPSTVGAFTIDRAALDADYRDSTAQIRTFEIAGRDVHATANGTLALGETGQSNLKFSADSSNLEEVGRLSGLPLTGIARTDGTITGNKAELKASGTFVGDGVRYEDNGALTLSSTYAITVPELAVADARITADTSGTFVTIAGQNINELTAKTEYADKQLTFDAVARQPQRSLSANGTLLVHPDHSEVHLLKLGVQVQGLTWQTPAAAQSTIRYGGGSIDVENLQLESANGGDQRISADGAFGQPDEELKVTLENVDLASVDALLLRPPQLTGRLDASAAVSGTKDAPQVKADFKVVQGGVKQFRYDSLAGTVDYAGKGGVTLDAKLQQSPTAWLTVKGYVPRAAFNADLRAAHAHQEPPAPEDRIDLHVDSSPVDLGLVQGFTTAVTNVTGTVQAKIDITGSAEDPHPTGDVTIANAAFTVDPTGVTYRNFAGQIELQSDKVHVAKLGITDDQQQTLSVTGDLAVHELSVGAFNVEIKADDFKVIDNKMGKMRVKSDVRLTGDLQYPRIEGDLTVSTGQINVDPILAAVGDSAYSTSQIDYGAGSEAAPARKDAAPREPSSAFETLQMDINLKLPDNVIVKGNDLNAGDAPIGLGALNVTLGGEVWVGKRPWDQVRLVGVVNTIRGTYDFQGRRFTILRDGTVRFEGLDELDPALNLKAQRIIQGVEANVNIQGRLHKPEIALSSAPPLDQADILALIVFNQPINQLGEGQQISLTQRAESLAAGAAAGQLAKSVGQALNLDTFDIQLAPDSGAMAEVTVGQQIGQNLYVKVQEDIGDVSATNFILEYELTNWLRLQSNLRQGNATQPSLLRRAQGSGFDLIFFLSY